MLDLIQHLQLPVIVVTSPQLGTLNHTFLTLKLLNQSNVKLAGVALNNCHDIAEDFIYHDNRKMIREFIRPAPFLEVSYGEKNNEHIKGFCDQLEQYL
jgi:dethiobiotin synthetase